MRRCCLHFILDDQEPVTQKMGKSMATGGVKQTSWLSVPVGKNIEVSILKLRLVQK